MKKTALRALPVLLAAASLFTVSACSRSQAATKTVSQLERGRYLVENVGLCSDCHTPRNADGSLDMTNHLRGSPIPFNPAIPMPWANVSPAIAGLPGYSDAQAVHFLTTGITRNNAPPRPPMPPYRFSREDAEAVVAYLRSVGTASMVTGN